jgi:hypothetical protein
MVTRIPALIFGGIMNIGVYTSPGDLLLGNGNLPERDERKMIFSPFGLGVFDLSVVDLKLPKTVVGSLWNLCCPDYRVGLFRSEKNWYVCCLELQ